MSFLRKEIWYGELWYFIVLFVAFIISLWYGAVHFFTPKIEKLGFSSPPPNITDILPKFRNGDILLLSGNTFGEKVIKFWHRSYFNHIAMIFRDALGAPDTKPENITFLWESDLGQNTRNGPRIIKLMDKLSKWRGSRIGMYRKYIPTDLITRPSERAIVSHADTYFDSGTEMDISMMSWFLSDYPDSWLFRKLKGAAPKVYCSELVAETLQKFGFMNKTKHPSWFTPEIFASGSINKFLTGGLYGECVYFTF